MRFIKLETAGLTVGIYGLLWPMMGFVNRSMDPFAWPTDTRGTLVALLPLAIGAAYVMAVVRRMPARQRPVAEPDAMRFWKLETIGLTVGSYALLWPILGFVHGSMNAGDWPIGERETMVVMLPLTIVAAFVMTIIRRRPIKCQRDNRTSDVVHDRPCPVMPS